MDYGDRDSGRVDITTGGFSGTHDIIYTDTRDMGFDPTQSGNHGVW